MGISYSYWPSSYYYWSFYNGNAFGIYIVHWGVGESIIEFSELLELLELTPQVLNSLNSSYDLTKHILINGHLDVLGDPDTR